MTRRSAFLARPLVRTRSRSVGRRQPPLSTPRGVVSSGRVNNSSPGPSQTPHRTPGRSAADRRLSRVDRSGGLPARHAGRVVVDPVEPPVPTRTKLAVFIINNLESLQLWILL
jgi:hypothetical protein